MKTSLLIAALLVGSALPARAEPPRWKFKPGQTYTYECRTEFHFASFQLNARAADVNAPATRPEPPPAVTMTAEEFAKLMDDMLRKQITNALEKETDPVRRAGLQGLLRITGPIPNSEVRKWFTDPQWETVTLTAYVAAIGDDGTARLTFKVDAVRIETRFDDTGAHAEWDSKEGSPAQFAGFKPYEAMVGHSFEALIGADGTIREVKNDAWPAAGKAGEVTRKDRREASAANATHEPTPARAWLEMLFTLTPTGGDQWEKTVMMPEKEVLSARTDSPELAGGFQCVRAKVKSRDREHAVDGAKLAFKLRDKDLAVQLCSAAQKLGESWFSPVAGCLVKSEMKSSSEANGSRFILGSFNMDVELKNRGFREATPAEPTPPAPTK